MYVIKRNFFDLPNCHDLPIKFMTLLPNGHLAIVKKEFQSIILFDPISCDYIGESIFTNHGYFNLSNFTALSNNDFAVTFNSSSRILIIDQNGRDKHNTIIPGIQNGNIHNITELSNGLMAVSKVDHFDVSIFDSATGNYLRSLEVPENYGLETNRRSINLVTALSNGELALTKKDRHSVFVFDSTTGKYLRALKTAELNGQEIKLITALPNDTLAIVKNGQSSIHLFNTNNGEHLRTIETSNKYPVNLMVSLSQNELAVTHKGQLNIDVYDTSNGTYLRSIENPGQSGRMGDKREISIMIALPNGNLAITKTGPSGVYILQGNSFNLIRTTEIISQGYRCKTSFFSKLPVKLCLHVSQMLANDIEEVKALSKVQFFQPQFTPTLTLKPSLSAISLDQKASEEPIKNPVENSSLLPSSPKLGTVEQERKKETPLCSPACSLL